MWLYRTAKLQAVATARKLSVDNVEEKIAIGEAEPTGENSGQSLHDGDNQGDDSEGVCNQHTGEQVKPWRQSAPGENSSSTPLGSSDGSGIQVLQPIEGLRDWSITDELIS